MDQAYFEGRAAYKNGKPMSYNPYDKWRQTKSWSAWVEGWLEESYDFHHQ